MTDDALPYNPIGTPADPPGFLDSQFGGVPPSVDQMQSQIDRAQAVVEGVRSRINDGLMARTVDAAVAASMLSGKVADQMRGKVNLAESVVSESQGRIAQELIGRIGSALESVAPMGVEPLSIGGECQTPVCVEIREASLRGDVAPALEYYRLIVAPLKTGRGLEYARELEKLESMLSGSDSALRDFATGVARYDSGESGILRQELQLPEVGRSNVSPDVSVVPFASITKPVAPSLPIPPTNIAPGAPNIAPNGGPYWNVGQIIGFTPQGVPIAATPEISGYTCALGPGYDPSINPPFVPPGIGGCPTGYVPVQITTPPGAGIPPKPGGPLPPPITQPPPVTTPPPSGQPPATCPPPPKPDCAPVKYRLWCSSNGALYILEADKSPDSKDDESIWIGYPGPGMVAAIKAGCPDDGSEDDTTAYDGPPVMPGLGDACLGLDLAPGLVGGEKPLTLDQWLGLTDKSGKSALAEAIDAVPFPLSGIARWLDEWLRTWARNAGDIAHDLGFSGEPNAGKLYGLTSSSGLLGFLSQWTGGAFDTVRRRIQYQQNALLPSILPDASEADRAWLTNVIDDEAWRCWTLANGRKEQEARAIRRSLHARFSTFEVATMRQREIITDAEARERIRANGHIPDTDADAAFELVKQLPAPSDIIRMMVRDADDAEAVQKFGMDDEFTSKYAQQLKEWASRQGMTDQHMQYLWRSHWSLPAPGQLFDMYHRLRKLPAGHPAAVDFETIRQALIQQDILPFWIPKFEAISFRPLGRLDASKAYQLGAITRDDVRESWEAQGYTDAHAEALTEYTERRRKLTLLRSSAISQFARGELTLDEMTEALRLEGMRPDDYEDVGKRAARLLSAKRRKACAAALRKRYLSAEIDDAEATGSLAALGMNESQIASIHGAWQCEMTARGKELPIASLNNALEARIIDMPEYIRRARRLGWSADDAVILYRIVARKLEIKATKDEERRAAREKAEAEKILRQTQAADRANAAAAQSAQNRADRMQRAGVLRKRRQLEAAQSLAPKLGVEFADAVPLVEQVYRDYRDTSGALLDEVIAALVVGSRDKSIQTIGDYSRAVGAALTTILAEQPSLIG